MPGPDRRTVLAALTAATLMTSRARAEDAKAPRDVVRNLLDAMQANDAARIRAAFAEDAGQAYGTGRAKSGDAFRAWLESDIIGPHGRVDDATLTVDGDAVVVTGRYRNDNGYSSAADFLMTVADGRITSWRMRY